MSEQYPIKQYEAFINQFAWKVLRRVHAAGLKTMQIDDIKSECSIAWLMANRSFDPSKGVPFLAYLKRGMIIYVNAWINKELKGLGTISLNETIFENKTVEDTVAADNDHPVDIIIVKQRRRYVMSRLSERTRIFVKLLDNPTPEIVEAHRALRARGEWAKARGIHSMAPKTINAQVIFEIMGAQTQERAKIYRELKDMSKRMSGR